MPRLDKGVQHWRQIADWFVLYLENKYTKQASVRMTSADYQVGEIYVSDDEREWIVLKIMPVASYEIARLWVRNKGNPPKYHQIINGVIHDKSYDIKD